MSSKTVFCIDVAGSRRTLFTVRGKPNGDLLITRPSGTINQGLLSSPIESGALRNNPSAPKVLQDRMSVHRLQSPTYTMIKRTLVLSDNTHRTSSALNDAVKKKTGYAFTFGGRWFDLRTGQIVTENSRTRLIKIGEYDPAQSTLYLVALLAHSDLEFPSINDGGTKVAQEVFGEFRIVVLSSLVPIPSHNTAQMHYAISGPPEKLRPEATGIIKGNNAEISLGLYRAARDSAIKSFIDDVLPRIKDQALAKRLSAVLPTLKPGGHFPLGPDIAPRSGPLPISEGR